LKTRTQLDSARLYADTLHALAKELQNENGKAKAHYYYGVLARHEGKFAQAIDHLNQYIVHFEDTGDSIRVAYGLFQLSAVNTTSGDYERSLEALYRILHIYETDSSLFDIGYTLNGIGVIYKKMGKYEDAIKTYFKALAIYDNLGNEQEDRAILLGNIANAYAETHRIEEARNYYEQALHIDKAIGSEWGMAYDLENIGYMLAE